MTQSGTFGSSFNQTFPVPQAGATTAWSAFVEAQDGSYHGAQWGTVGPCGTPVDDCADLPGNQPAGTPCLPPPDVTRADSQALEGCDLAFGGTTYGAGELTYDEQYTDTYVFNGLTSTWDLVTDTTATIANVVFTPWSVAEQVEDGCVVKPEQPPATHEPDSSSQLDCDSDSIVTTTTTTMTPFVYDAATNSWVPGEPQSHTTTSESPAQPGDCDDSGVSPNDLNGPPTATTVVDYSQATTQVPTSVAAGQAGTAAPAVVTAAAVTSGPAVGGRVPLLLLVSGAALLSIAGRRFVRS